MMKKIVVLMLVLGLASFASAGLTWTDGAGGDVSTITLTSITDTAVVYLTTDVAANGSFYAGPMYSGNGVAGITAVSTLAAAGPDGTNVLYGSGTFAGSAWLEIKDADPDTAPGLVVGNAFMLTIHATGAGPGQVTFTSDHFGTGDSLLVKHIPEPATIALLGLGGLLLRKKRKA